MFYFTYFYPTPPTHSQKMRRGSGFNTWSSLSHLCLESCMLLQLWRLLGAYDVWQSPSNRKLLAGYSLCSPSTEMKYCHLRLGKY